MIVEMSRGSSQSLEHGSSATSIAAVEAFRALLIADYKREQTNLDNLEYGTTIQYFKNNYARNQKVKCLDQQVVLTVQTSSSSK
jgi:hypothetical protein